MRKNGAVFSAEATIAKLNIDTEQVVTATLHDITERLAQEEQLRAAKERAELANRTKSQFLATMSHELRTPLNAIIGFAQAMQSGIGGTLTAKQIEYLSYIESSGVQLLSLVNDVIDLSKIELGEMDIADETHRLEKIIEKSVRMFNDKSMLPA